LFSVRFGGGTWHRFLPAKPGYPALFALSCHTDEARITLGTRVQTCNPSVAPTWPASQAYIAAMSRRR